MQTYGEDVDAACRAWSRRPPTSPSPKTGEDKPGGGATSRGSTDTANAFSLSSGNMDFKRELDFKIGNAIFRKNWVSAPSSTDASDGFGPLFNSRACQNCHLKDGRGHPPVLGRRARRFRLDAGQALGPARHRRGEGASSRPISVELDPRTDLWRPAPGLRSIQGLAAEGKLKIEYKEQQVKLADGESVSLRAPTLFADRPWLWPDQRRCHDFAARRAADDRAWPARGRAGGADPRSRSVPTTREQ